MNLMSRTTVFNVYVMSSVSVSDPFTKYRSTSSPCNRSLRTGLHVPSSHPRERAAKSKAIRREGVW